MSFACVPKESKTQINKAGRALAERSFKSSNKQEAEAALDLVNRWRACHAYPINTFNTTLRKKNSEISLQVITAQRLKRMSTIIKKLRRYKTMKLTTMQDIAGLRAVVDSLPQVYKLADKYRKSKKMLHQLYNEKDYIENPRDEDGYRCLHLIYRYKNKKKPEYDNLFLEIQIRTKLQHVWATAVETMGTFLGQALKSRQGDQEWLDFFAIASSAFAYMENSKLVPRYSKLSKKETFLEVARMENKLKALDKMSGFSKAVEVIKNKKKEDKNMFKSSYYHLIILNSLKRTLQIKAYNRSKFEQALEDYVSVEERVIKGEKIEPVLVSAGSLSMLRRAYPNFFLDITEFTKKISEIILSVK